MKTEQAIAILSDELKVIQSVTAYCRDFEKEETKSLVYRINRGKAIEQEIRKKLVRRISGHQRL